MVKGSEKEVGSGTGRGRGRGSHVGGREREADSNQRVPKGGPSGHEKRIAWKGHVGAGQIIDACHRSIIDDKVAVALELHDELFKLSPTNCTTCITRQKYSSKFESTLRLLSQSQHQQALCPLRTIIDSPHKFVEFVESKIVGIMASFRAATKDGVWTNQHLTILVSM